MQLADALKLAIAHQNAGRAEAAADVYRQILAQDPRNPPANTLLARILLRQGRLADGEAHAATAAKAAPDYAQAWSTRGELLEAMRRNDSAAASYRRALALQPNLVPPLVGLGNLQQLAGDDRAAVASYGRALAVQPGHVPAANNLAQALLKAGEPAAALAATQRTLVREPNNIRAIAYRTTALEELGRTEEVDRLIGFGTATRPIRFPVPDGYADHAEFNAALCREVHAHPNLKADWDPLRRAIRGGAIVTQFLEHKSPAIAAFERMLVAGLNAYIAGLPEDPVHPHFRRRPRGYQLDVWANILGDEGHQSAHIHNLGWLSGTYYAAVPTTVRPDDPARAGWLEFNRPGYGIPHRGTRPLDAVCPEIGMAMVFPSYVWHSTIPFRGGGERISIAFDLHIQDR